MKSSSIRKGFVKIHQGVPTMASPDHAFLRFYSTFLRLKSLYVGGCIHNYRKRFDELANKLGISSSTVRNAIKYLQQIGFVFPEGNHLRFISADKVSNILKIKPQASYRIIADDSISYKIQTLALHENINKQNEAIKARFIKAELESVYGKVKNIQFRVVKKLRKHLASMPIEAIKKRIYRQPVKFKAISAHATLSRSGVAKVLGFKNKSSASRLIKILVSKGFLKDVKNMHRVIYNKISQSDFRKLHLESPYYWTLGKVFLAKPNSIYVKL